MPVVKNPGSTSLVDILDRVLDQGIRIHAWPQVTLAGARPPAERVRIVVESVETHLEPLQEAPVLTGTGA
ncbi:MAG: gas vesicle protein [Myxococcaceae bacterium]|nr:gas vesicle protein [Myxococcaceae bacterium]